MKKYSLIALSALFSIGIAIASPAHGIDSNLLSQRRGVENESAFKAHALELFNSQPYLLTRAQSTTPIIKNPVGTYKYYTKDIKGLSQSQTGYEIFEENGDATSIVFGANNTVFIQELHPFYNFKTYVSGTIKNGVITVSLPQTVTDDFYYTGYPVNLCMVKKRGNTYEVTDIDHVDYIYNEETGSLTLDLPGDNGEYALGYCFTNGAWTEEGILSESYKPFNGVNTLPADIKESQYMYREGDFGFPLFVSKDENNVYFRGMSPNFPQGVVIAKIDGNKATIPQNQIIGAAYGNWVYTKVMSNMTQMIVNSATYSMNVDWTANVFTGNDYMYSMVLLAGPESSPYYLEPFNNFSIYIQESYAGTPSNPKGVTVNTDIIDMGIYILAFELSTLSTTNNVLLEDNLYYRVYVNGDLYEFEENEDDGIYMGLGGDVTDVPFLFNNGSDIVAWSYTLRTINLYLEGVSTIGVQQVYKYDGQETVSDILTYTIPEDAGVNAIEGSSVLSESFYNLSGQKIENPSNGIFIRKAQLSSGETVTSKIIRK